MLAELVATSAAGVFAGAAAYISLVEHPARLSCGVELAVTEWKPSYHRATWMQAPLALVGSISALTVWWLGRDLAWLVGGLLLLLIVPFTLIVIMPTNKSLQSQELDLRSERAASLLRRWGHLHAVRSVLSGAAFLIFLLRLTITH